jgi:hypothetical protein
MAAGREHTPAIGRILFDEFESEIMTVGINASFKAAKSRSLLLL